MRAASTYRGARRNQCRAERGIWGEQWYYHARNTPAPKIKRPPRYQPGPRPNMRDLIIRKWQGLKGKITFKGKR